MVAIIGGPKGVFYNSVDTLYIPKSCLYRVPLQDYSSLIIYLDILIKFSDFRLFFVILATNCYILSSIWRKKQSKIEHTNLVFQCLAS
ncbi:hypothetical protein G6L69_10655 [Agrobacterium tumefaciens]|nr:hypothetical protein [Agrobacterium tumefaciens]NSZ22375.1 hypothetical protein [Agrobacterium tumefaciens]NTB18463.1 hypothetical protein [Agrobacterium tumefaciens]